MWFMGELILISVEGVQFVPNGFYGYRISLSEWLKGRPAFAACK